MVLKVLKERIEEMEDILKEKTKITPVRHKIPQYPANAKRIGRDKDSNPKSMVSRTGTKSGATDYTRYGLCGSAPRPK